MHRRVIPLVAIILLLFVIVVAFSLLKQIAKPSPQLAVDKVSQLGQLPHPDKVATRDGGFSALVGNQILWTFGDTLFSQKNSLGESGISNSASLAAPSRPFELSGDTDSLGLPEPLLNFSAEELAYNRQSGQPNERFALWPTSIVSTSNGAYIFYLKLKVHPGYLNFETLGSGLAKLANGRTRAERLDGLLFNNPEPLFGDAAVTRQELTYLYDCNAGGGFKAGCRLARVATAKLSDKSAYQYWDGSRWSNDINSTKTVFEGPASDFSISWNSYLNRYLAVYSPLLSNDVVAITAEEPEGPWSDPVTLVKGSEPAPNRLNYGGRHHPDLSLDPKKLIVSYYTPRTDLSGQIQLYEISLR
jgi:hypothetical protein